MTSVKLIVTSKNNLQFKYGKNFSKIEALLNKLKVADKKKGLDTKIIFIDDPKSAKAAGIKKVSSISEKECKRVVDDLYKKYIPSYIAILGAGDVIPFHEIVNPAEDEDATAPSDLPYACDAAYSKTIDAYTGPTRVVGRIPDIAGLQKNTAYLEKIIANIINQKPIDPDQYRNYFAVTAQVWKISTQMSLQSIFSDNKKLFPSPAKSEKTPAKYSKTQLKPLTHFFNCHGAKTDPCYYGQKGNNYPEALRSSNLEMNVSSGTIIAAECCYGAQLYDPTVLQPEESCIANIYLENGAIAMLGSSTIAYGPSDSNSLADLITSYFIKSILSGASTGRALLEARQKFLSDSGPQLDPYELKTLAQFYLLGDPSVQPATREDTAASKTGGGSIENNRLNLFNKGVSLKNSMAPSKKQKVKSKPGDPKKLKEILKTSNFENAEKEFVYDVKPKGPGLTGLQKKLAGTNARFRTFIKPGNAVDVFNIKVLVVKEDNQQVLGWRVYESR